MSEYQYGVRFPDGEVVEAYDLEDAEEELGRCARLAEDEPDFVGAQLVRRPSVKWELVNA